MKKDSSSTYYAFIQDVQNTSMEAQQEGKDIRLVVISTWLDKKLKQFARDNFITDPNYESKNTQVMGYEVKVIDDLDYNIPVQYIIG